MTLDELIGDLVRLRDEHGGDTLVYNMDSCGCCAFDAAPNPHFDTEGYTSSKHKPGIYLL